MRFLQSCKHRQIARAARRLLAFDDISQGGYVDRRLAELYAQGATAQTLKGTNAVDCGHEIELQTVAVADDPKQSAHRVIGT